MGLLAGGFFSQTAGGGGPTQVLDTEVTSGSAEVYSSTTEVVTDMSTYTQTYNYFAYGFDAGSDYYAYGPGFGSIVDGTFDDAGSNSRLIDSCYWFEGTGDPIGEDFVYFVLDTTSVPNTDTTFKYIIIDGNQYNRADAFYIASVDGGTGWEWALGASATNPFSGANPDPFEVWAE